MGWFFAIVIVIVLGVGFALALGCWGEPTTSDQAPELDLPVRRLEAEDITGVRIPRGVRGYETIGVDTVLRAAADALDSPQEMAAFVSENHEFGIVTGGYRCDLVDGLLDRIRHEFHATLAE